ncbi:MAG: DNA repair protein RecO [Pseudomonadota bacterium]
MNWSDDGFVLGGRKFGEGGLVLDVLTAAHGRRAGLVYGGASRARRAQYEPGNALRVSWTARLEDQLGRFDVAELVTARASSLFHAPDALAAIQTITAILRDVITEGDQAGSDLHGPTSLVLDALTDPDIWPALYVRWELGLLSALGFGLDLTACAVTGATDGLTHVSPRTGRAVQGHAVPEYTGQLLPLPGFLTGTDPTPKPSEILDGLSLTGRFLTRRAYAPLNRPLPQSRPRMITRLTHRLSG